LVGARVLGQSFSFFGSASKAEKSANEANPTSDATKDKEKSNTQGSGSSIGASAVATSSSSPVQAEAQAPPVRGDRWLSMRFRTNWLWWVVGGYFASCWVFNCADLLNQFILPDDIFTEAAESVSACV